MADYEVRIRVFIFGIIILLGFAVLSFNLWGLQIESAQEYQRLADRNRFRTETVEAEKGVIYDRNGELLVKNRVAFDVVIIPAYLPEEETERAEVLARLSELLDTPITTAEGVGRGKATLLSYVYHNRIDRFPDSPHNRFKGDGFVLVEPIEKGIKDMVDEVLYLAPYLPITVKKNVDPVTAARIEEEQLHLPGVLVEVRATRDYPQGELLSHVLGYVGPIPQERAAEYEEKGYDPNDQVGLSGIEAFYEDVLHGTKGRRTVEVDVSGRNVRVLEEAEEATPGDSIQLTIDTELQEFMTEALQKGIEGTDEGSAGVAIAMNPRNGEILALVSLPTYDNNLFAQGISLREYKKLQEDPRTPLVNHAISGLYPPGSTFKVIPASAVLQDGVVDLDTSVTCEGTLYVPNKNFPDDPELAQPFYCWAREGHGPVTFLNGLAWSCDIYFYTVTGGYGDWPGLGLDRLVYYADEFGLGEPTGIDLPGELAGLVPTPRWKRLNYAETWVTGDTYNMAIGQGFVLATPLQILNATAAIANGGTLFRPHIMQNILDTEGNVVEVKQPEVIRVLPVDPEVIAYVQQGLWAVTLPGGTAYEDFYVPGVNVAGKTGTAEFCDKYPTCLDANGRVRTSHAWFTAYAPVEDPRIALVVFVYGGGEGSKVAVPIASEILRYYFGIETEADEKEVEVEKGPPLPPPLNAVFAPRLLGTDMWGHDGAAINGFVLNHEGEGIPGIEVEIAAEGEPVTTLTTGPNGQFDYNEIDPLERQKWAVTLPDYPKTLPLEIDAVRGYKYMVEFRLTVE